MPALQEITGEVVRDHINRAVTEVFKTMLARTPTLLPNEAPSSEPVTAASNRPLVVGTVGFLGEITGLIYLHLDLQFARLCTCHLLGMTEEELNDAGDEVINDAVGEITNMTVGSFKNGLSDAGYPCMLTIPSILRGTQFSIEAVGGAKRHIYQFNCSNHRVVADIVIKGRDTQ
jgi:chemotaxis protein CheX